MKYYLCGPLDSVGDSNKNREAFKNAATILRDIGYDIVSPIEIAGEGSLNSYEEYIKADIYELLKCEAIILLPGWPQSKGARGELFIALSLSMKVFFFPVDNNEAIVDMNYGKIGFI